MDRNKAIVYLARLYVMMTYFDKLGESSRVRQIDATIRAERDRMNMSDQETTKEILEMSWSVENAWIDLLDNPKNFEHLVRLSD